MTFLVRVVPVVLARVVLVVLAALVVLAGSFTTATAQAQGNPYDREIERLSKVVVSQAARPEGMIPLLQLRQRVWGGASAEASLRVLDRLAKERALPPARKVFVQTIAALIRLSAPVGAAIPAGTASAPPATVQSLGYISNWNVVGPFDNEGKRGLAQDFGPEDVITAAPDLASQWQGRERPVRWRQMPDVTDSGGLALGAVLRPSTHSCAYAVTDVYSTTARPLSLWVGASGAFRLWWNGAAVLEDTKYRGADRDRFGVTVAARTVNHLVIKSCVADGDWTAFVRVGDAEGGVIPQGVTIGAPDATTDAASPTTITTEGAPTDAAAVAIVTPLTALAAAATREGATASALEAYVTLLALTDADDPAENLAKQFAFRATELEPTFDRLRLAYGLSDDRSEESRFVQIAKEKFARDPRTTLLAAEFALDGVVPESALAMLDISKFRAGSMEWVDARYARARAFGALGLTRAAEAEMLALSTALAADVGFVLDLADAHSRAGSVDANFEATKRAVALSRTSYVARQRLLNLASARADMTLAKETATSMRRLARGSTSALTGLANVFDGFIDGDSATALYRQATELAPDDAGAHVAYANYLLASGDRNRAIVELRTALRLKPQDAETRQLLATVQPEVRKDEAYAASSETLLSRRSDGGSYPVSLLQDLSVVTVFENGLGSKFHQVAAEIHNQEGARQWRTYTIPYDPGAQEVDIRVAKVHRGGDTLEALDNYEQQMGEPWYRMYYDTRALIVVFPNLEPGDVVELSYRVDDVSHQNMFRDYFGDVQYFRSHQPNAHEEYVLITPLARTIYMKQPEMEGLVYTRTEDNGQRIDRFVAENVAPILAEENMPGTTEIAPYLHVSTYSTWQDVGHWYWGLIRDQLYADDSLKRTVADLMRGANDTETKVRRIYDWVVSNTRYVALEFGIHGFKPYRVPQIVQRGFGDCKDKASLLYTMLTDAGVEARIVLIRTRRNGHIADAPASLSIFDHAIAYVPELDRYLDGTAEHNGSREFPSMDQGAEILIVGPDSAEFKRSPVLPPEGDLRIREMNVTLAADGSAELQVAETVQGAQAGAYRETYEAEGTRKERLERSLRAGFPGLELIEQQFVGLDDREVSPRYTYRATVPRFADVQDTTLTIAPAMLGELTRAFARTPTRQYLLDLGGTAGSLETRVLRLPEGFRAKELPENGEARSRFGVLSIAVEQSGATVTVKTKFELAIDRVAPSEYAEFRQWVQRADVMLRQRVVLERGSR